MNLLKSKCLVENAVAKETSYLVSSYKRARSNLLYACTYKSSNIIGAFFVAKGVVLRDACGSGLLPVF
jgi:hypothetical protein